MPDKFFLSASGADLVGKLQGSLQRSPAGSSPVERMLWSGRCAVAEYAFDKPASLPRWTLPEETEVVVTTTRVAFVNKDGTLGGELLWPWPQHLRVQPGNRETGRSATVTQIQLVCAGPAGAFPALVFAGGDLATVADADRLANVFRQAIARFRVENTAELGLTLPQSRVLSRLVIGPEFSNYQGGEGQTVSLLGAVPVDLPDTVAPHAAPADGFAASSPGSVASWAADPRAAPSDPAQPRPQPPGLAPSDVAQPRPQQPGLAPSDLAARAADLAARVAGLVSGSAALDASLARYETRTTNLSAFLSPAESYASAAEYGYVDEPPAEYHQDGYDQGNSDSASARAEAVRRAAARLASNSARTRGATPRRSDDDLGAPSRGHHNV